MPNGKHSTALALQEPTEDLTPFDTHKRRVIPLERIIELRSKGLSYSAMAGVLGCSKQAISFRLKDHIEDIEGLEHFKNGRADFLALIQRKLITSLTVEDIKKASAYQRVGMFGILYDKERLERGQVTEIVGYADLNVAFAQVVAEREKMAKELGIIDVKSVPQDEQ